MTDTAAAEGPDPLKSVAAAMEAAVQAVKDGATTAQASAVEALPEASRFLSRFLYTTCYTISYGVVFPTVLLAKSLPTNNAFVHGMVDGARAAIDSVTEMKTKSLPATEGLADPSEPAPGA